jgi:hypothetical protein
MRDGPKRRMMKHTAWLASVMVLSISIFSSAQYDYLVTISVVSVSGEGEPVARERYRSGEKVHVKITITNTSPNTLNIPKGEDYSRPRLYRDGQLITYRKDVSERIEKQETGDSSRITGFLFLKPNEPQSDIIDLNYWYEFLKPGHYKLSLQRIFFKQRAASNTVFFEVLPCEEKGYKSRAMKSYHLRLAS